MIGYASCEMEGLLFTTLHFSFLMLSPSSVQFSGQSEKLALMECRKSDIGSENLKLVRFSGKSSSSLSDITERERARFIKRETTYSGPQEHRNTDESTEKALEH
jgi:hypothetical protein